MVLVLMSTSAMAFGFSSRKSVWLTEKDPATWQPVVGGAWGGMYYDDSTFNFGARRLDRGETYTLIRYEDPYPGDVTCLGTKTANRFGSVFIRGNMQDGGPKVWLVLSDDVDCAAGVLTGWNPSEYMFEKTLI